MEVRWALFSTKKRAEVRLLRTYLVAFMLCEQFPQDFHSPARERDRLLIAGSVDPELAVLGLHVCCQLPRQFFGGAEDFAARLMVIAEPGTAMIRRPDRDACCSSNATAGGPERFMSYVVPACSGLLAIG